VDIVPHGHMEPISPVRACFRLKPISGHCLRLLPSHVLPLTQFYYE